MMDSNYPDTGPAPDSSINNIPGARPSSFTTALVVLLLIMTGSWLSPEPVRAAIQTGQFVEVTRDAGIDDSNRRTFGVSWGDMNGDGLPDIWISHHARKPALYINNGDGTFTDSTASVMYDNASDMHGAAWADFDNDGDQDLFQIVGGGSGCGEGSNQFFINDGNTLQDEAGSYGLAYPMGRGRTPLWFDWNGDGYLDIFLSNLKRSCDDQAQSALFTRQDGYFTNGNDLTGIETDMGSDPVFAQLTHMGPANAPVIVVYSNPSPHRVYRYDSVPFRDATYALSGLSTGAVEDAAIADFNGDLRTDFYFARAYTTSSVIKYNETNIRAGILTGSWDAAVKSFSFTPTAADNVTFKIESFQVTPADIYIGSDKTNPPAKTFTLTAADAAGMPDTTGTELGIFIGYDTDTSKWQFSVRSNKWLMLHVSITVDTTNAAAAISPPSDVVGFDDTGGAENDKLFIQTADGLFQEAPEVAALGPTACHSVAAADFDNDMDVDIYLVCRSIVKNFDNILYENIGNNMFMPVTGHGAEGSAIGLGESVALADYNEDGFMDIFVTNGKYSSTITEGPDQLFMNTGNTNHWLEIDLVGVVSNRDGIGARVLATTPDGKTQLREQNGGIHAYSQNYQRIHFGLGGNTRVDRLVIQWPSGIEQATNNIDADQVYEATELDITGSSTSGDGPLTVYFTSSSAGLYKPSTYEWDFDSDGSPDSTDPGPSYTYTSPGKYTVTLTLRDSLGDVITTATRTDYITVNNYIPVNNNPPSAPLLLYPADGQTGLGTAVEFVWEESIDPDGDAVSYRLQVCKESDFATGCVDTGNASSAKGVEDIFYAGTGAGLMIFGMVLAGSGRSRRKTAVLLIAMLTVAMLSVSCGSGGGSGGGGTTPPDIVTQEGTEVSQTISGLMPGTTYYWKVTAYDGNGGKAESGIRSFTTE